MAGVFEKRERGIEAKWAMDEESRFKVYVRRNRQLGLWAAGLMGLKDGEAKAYADEVVKADFQKPGEEDVFVKLQADFKAKGLNVAETDIRTHMSELLEQAAHDLSTEPRTGN